MADTPKITLDKAGLKKFIDNQLADFQNDLDKIAHKDDGYGVTMDALLRKGEVSSDEEPIYGKQSLLAIGGLASDKPSGGDEIVTKIKDTAESISEVYVQQIKLFKDLHDNLETTVNRLMDGQHDNLAKIDGKSFLDDIGVVPGDFQGSGGDSGQS